MKFLISFHIPNMPFLISPNYINCHLPLPQVCKYKGKAPPLLFWRPNLHSPLLSWAHQLTDSGDPIQLPAGEECRTDDVRKQVAVMEGEREQQEERTEEESDRRQDLLWTPAVRKLQPPQTLRQQRGPQSSLPWSWLDCWAWRHYLSEGSLSLSILRLFDFLILRNQPNRSSYFEIVWFLNFAKLSNLVEQFKLRKIAPVNLYAGSRNHVSWLMCVRLCTLWRVLLKLRRLIIQKTMHNVFDFCWLGEGVVGVLEISRRTLDSFP